MTTPRTPQAGGSRPPFRRGGRRRRQCFCKESTVDYKDVSSIRRFITDRGRIEAGKKAGNCAKCQRTLTIAIKRARHLALLPYAPEHLRVTGAVSTSKISDDDEETVTEDADEFDDSAPEIESESIEAVADEISADEVPQSDDSDETPESDESEESAEPVAESEDAPAAEVEESEVEETEPAADNVSADEAEESPVTEETAEEATDSDDAEDAGDEEDK